MAKSGMRLVRRPKRPPKTQHKVVRDEVRTRLEPIAEAHQASFKKVVSNWSDSSRPEFKSQVRVGLKLIEIRLIIKNKGKLLGDRSKATVGDLWGWINTTGTKPHIIKPKATNKRGLLFFQSGGPGSYQAKTGANPARSGGSGKVSGGKLRVAKVVKHPGFEPRHFDDAINRDFIKKFRKAIDGGYKAGFRKVQRLNRS